MEKLAIESECEPIVQIWKEGRLVETLHMDADWFLFIVHDRVMLKERPFTAKFGYIETVITDIAEFSDERRQPCTEK